MDDKTKLKLIKTMCQAYYEGYTDHEVDSEALNLLIDMIFNVLTFGEPQEVQV